MHLTTLLALLLGAIFLYEVGNRPARKNTPFVPLPQLTRELVLRSFDPVRERYRKSLAEVFSLASSDDRIRQLEITLHGDDAAYRFPIAAHAWTEDWKDPATTASEAIVGLVDVKVPLLPAEFQSLPIGRPDLAGLDFTPELILVNEVLLEETRAAWEVLQALCRPDIAVFVGAAGDLFDEFKSESPSVEPANRRPGDHPRSTRRAVALNVDRDLRAASGVRHSTVARHHDAGGQQSRRVSKHESQIPPPVGAGSTQGAIFLSTHDCSGWQSASSVHSGAAPKHPRGSCPSQSPTNTKLHFPTQLSGVFWS